jgi:rhodanese-related sulfurtransferase
MDEATEDFSSGQIPHGIESINNALELLQKYLSAASEEKLKKVQKFIVYCATYRFAF